MYTNDDTPDSKCRAGLIQRFHQTFDKHPAKSNTTTGFHHGSSLNTRGNVNAIPIQIDSKSLISHILHPSPLPSLPNNDRSHQPSSSPSISTISEITQLSMADLDAENEHRYVNPPPYPSAYPHNWYPSHPPPGPHAHTHVPPPRYPQPSTTTSRRTNRFSRTSNQGESTLSALTERFIQLLDDYSTNHGEGELDLNIAVQELGVQKRRLYDITNVLEGVGLIKKDRNQVAWADRSQLRSAKTDKENESHKTAAMAALRTEIDAIRNHGSYIDNCIEKLSNNVRDFTKCRKESRGDESTNASPPEESNLFVTKRQITALQAYHNDTVIAIRAPSGTSLEVPNPDEGMRPGVRRFQIFLTSPGPEAGEVKVMQVQSNNGTHSYQRHPSHYPYAYAHWGPYHAPYPPPHNAPPHSHHPTLPVQQPVKSSDDDKNRQNKNSNGGHSNVPFQRPIKEEEEDSKSGIGRDLPRLPLPHLQRPRDVERRSSTTDIKSPRKRRPNTMSSYPQIPPRPSLQRRSTEPYNTDASSLGLPYPKVAKSADGSRKPLKAALKSPHKSPIKASHQHLPSPIKSSRVVSLQAPMSPKKCAEGNNNAFPCPSPIGRSNELMTAPLHSPMFNEAFLASPIPTSRVSMNGAKFSFCPQSPFPSFSPGIGLHSGAPEFSPFIASPSIARMEREMQGDKASPGSTKIPTLF